MSLTATNDGCSCRPSVDTKCEIDLSNVGDERCFVCDANAFSDENDDRRSDCGNCFECMKRCDCDNCMGEEIGEESAADIAACMLNENKIDFHMTDDCRQQCNCICNLARGGSQFCNADDEYPNPKAVYPACPSEQPSEFPSKQPSQFPSAEPTSTE